MIFDNVLVPDGWETVGFDDSAWPVGNGAFASGGACTIQQTQHTEWPINTEIVIRRTFTVPTGTTVVHIAGTVDNDITIYLNGNLITDWIVHEGCPQPDDVSFIAPPGTYHTGVNLLAIRARDRGAESFLDYRVEVQ
jgi:hypothetical protein